MAWTDATSMLAHQVKGAELSLWVDASSIAAGAILHQLSHYDRELIANFLAVEARTSSRLKDEGATSTPITSRLPSHSSKSWRAFRAILAFFSMT